MIQRKTVRHIPDPAIYGVDHITIERTEGGAKPFAAVQFIERTATDKGRTLEERDSYVINEDYLGTLRTRTHVPIEDINLREESIEAAPTKA